MSPFMIFVVSELSLCVVALVVLVEESVVVPIRREFGIMELFVIISNSLDVLWSISYIRIMGSIIVRWSQISVDLFITCSMF